LNLLQGLYLILGLFILIVAVPVAQLIKNPPAGYVPPVPKNAPKNTTKKPSTRNFEWKEMVKTKQFYFLWIMFALSSSAGLMIIGNIATIAKTQASLENGFFLVGLLAIFNAIGRPVAGFTSDKIGRLRIMMIVFTIQGINMALFATYTSPLGISIGTALAGIGYGSLLSLFPTTVADYYGVKNFGGNYGVLYTAWGISGTIGPIIAGIVVDKTGTYNLAYMISAGLLVVALILAVMTKPLKETKETDSYGKVDTLVS
jgi:OFA family oxalate/formate antiporter-like MFS transporter